MQYVFYITRDKSFFKQQLEILSYKCMSSICFMEFRLYHNLDSPSLIFTIVEIGLSSICLEAPLFFGSFSSGYLQGSGGLIECSIIHVLSVLHSFDVSLAFIINDVGFVQKLFICMLNECCIDFRMVEFQMSCCSYCEMSSLE